ncbi:MAG: hypothetical protein ABSG13_02900 [Bryobacteraceae bacterium]|jgi:hypothetical protein
MQSPLERPARAIRLQGGTIWHMSEHEKYEQVGRLAEEVSEVKGKLAHVNEKLTRAQADYQFLANLNVFQQLKVQDGQLIVPNAPTSGQGQPRTLNGLLSTHDLMRVLEERDRLTGEFNALAARLKTLAPHLL